MGDGFALAGSGPGGRKSCSKWIWSMWERVVRYTAVLSANSLASKDSKVLCEVVYVDQEQTRSTHRSRRYS